MDRSLFVGMSGAKQTLQAQAANANNLANVNTTAFRGDLEQFRAQPLFGPGHPSRVYAMMERPATDFHEGELTVTGRELDVGINGPGWLAIQDEQGKEAYTRAGDLHITAEGRLVQGSGRTVIGNNGAITIPPYQKIDIGADGTISIVPQGANAAGVVVVDRLKLVNPPRDQLEKGEDGLIRTRDGQPQPPAPEVKVVDGMLETSNVHPVTEMVQMIELQRRYEMHLKLMKTVADDAQASSQLMRIG